MSGDIKQIIWLPNAKEDLKKYIQYIKKDSPLNAIKVKTEILSAISNLLINPEKYPPDKFKLLNSASNFRAFELYKLRIAYYISEDQVMIIRIRHVKQEPMFY